MSSSGEIHRDYNLLRRVREKLENGNHPDYERVIEFSGKETPQVLFHGFGRRDPSTLASFQSNSLNPNNELLFFAPDPQTSVIHGMTLQGEVRGALAKAGLADYKNTPTGHPDRVAANPILDDHTYMMVAFAHVDTDLGKWVMDISGTWKALWPDYITDTDMSLEQLTIIRFDQAKKLTRNTKRLGKVEILFDSREKLRRKLEITTNQQEELRERLLKELR